MKYVMFETTYGGCRQHVPIIFPNTLGHLDVAKAIQDNPSLGLNRVVSAGFLSSLHLSIERGRKSTMLKLGPLSTDQNNILMNDYNIGLDVNAVIDPNAQLSVGATSSIEALQGLLSLVHDTLVPLDVISSWDPIQRGLASAWASASYINASDNPVYVPPKPSFTP